MYSFKLVYSPSSSFCCIVLMSMGCLMMVLYSGAMSSVTGCANSACSSRLRERMEEGKRGCGRGGV